MSSIDENRFKDLLKAAILEVLEERRDLIVEIIEDVVEDNALRRAIAEGEKTEVISREAVFQ